MWKLAQIAMLGVTLMPSAAFSAKCSGAQVSQVGRFQVARLGDRLFFRADALALDFDGSPVAYGTEDQGEENICVGLAPSKGPCAGRYQGVCYPICEQTFAAWSRSGGGVKDISRTMCSVGLGGGECSVPDVRLQDQPHADYFVSETSLRTSPPKGSFPAGWLRGQPAQLDPAVVRYIVAPPTLAQFGVHYGDVGIAYSVASHARVAFIVGDCCGLGEASVSLLAALNPQKPPVLTSHVNALGVPVMRYASGISGDFRFVILAGTADRASGRGNVTMTSSSELPVWIDGIAAVAAHATPTDDILACTATLRNADRKEKKNDKRR